MLGIALMLVSSVIGAGFVTGAELVVFFGGSGVPVAVIAVMVGLVLFGFLAMLVCVDSTGFSPPRVVFVPLYFAFFVIMTAGVVALSGIWVAVLSLILCVAIVLFGFERIVRVNKWLIAFVLGVIVWVSVGGFGANVYMDYDGNGIFLTGGRVVLYAGMNMLLFPVIRRARKNFSVRQVLTACGIAASILGGLVFLLLSAVPVDGGRAMPILALADNIAVRTAIFLSIFSSQFIALYNVSSSSKIKNKKQPLLLVAVCVVGFLFSLGGFTTLMSIVYPLIGLWMVFFVLGTFAWSCFWLRTHRR